MVECFHREGGMGCKLKAILRSFNSFSQASLLFKLLHDTCGRYIGAFARIMPQA